MRFSAKPTADDWRKAVGELLEAVNEDVDMDREAEAWDRLERLTTTAADTVDVSTDVIGAAPDLYEAASLVVDHMNPDPDDGLTAESHDDACRALEAAVAKAEGRES